MARMPGRAMFGFLNPDGSERSVGILEDRSRRLGPAAAMTTLEPRLNPVPE